MSLVVRCSLGRVAFSLSLSLSGYNIVVVYAAEYVGCFLSRFLHPKQNIRVVLFASFLTCRPTDRPSELTDGRFVRKCRNMAIANRSTHSQSKRKRNFLVQCTLGLCFFLSFLSSRRCTLNEEGRKEGESSFYFFSQCSRPFAFSARLAAGITYVPTKVLVDAAKAAATFSLLRFPQNPA